MENKKFVLMYGNMKQGYTIYGTYTHLQMADFMERYKDSLSILHIQFMEVEDPYDLDVALFNGGY